jgi:type II secretory pathway pseudopilin PulG
MSTGAKIAIGCGIVAVLAIVGIIVAIVAGGMFASKKINELSGGMEAQQEASEKIQELESEHPFAPPQDGIVGGDRADRFFAVTDDAWEGMQDWVEDMEERSGDIDSRGGEAGFGDAMAGLQGLGRSRVALAEALAAHDMPVSEYLWTGMSLSHAYESLDQPAETSGVPAENLEIAAENRERLAEITGGGEESNSKAVVLAIAWTLATSEGVTSSIPGLDTLGH